MSSTIDPGLLQLLSLHTSGPMAGYFEMTIVLTNFCRCIQGLSRDVSMTV